MQVTATMVKELREMTGAGMMDCKQALAETNGDIDAAVKYLREKGMIKASKKASRIAAEGIVYSYIHGGRIGSMVEINTETDFVAKNAEFQEFAKDIAMQIAAANPRYVSKEEVPQHEIDAEKEILRNQALNEGKPEKVVDKMVEGRINKFLEEICLLEQPFIKDPDRKVNDLLTEKIAKIGEKINIRRFARFEVGEGLQKKEENFAEEVAKQLG
ncbi:MAG: translation elongation factor Ts [Bacillota bacterium]|nr:translation elongation factor Ts [Bacillota bacterium]